MVLSLSSFFTSLLSCLEMHIYERGKNEFFARKFGEEIYIGRRKYKCSEGVRIIRIQVRNVGLEITSGPEGYGFRTCSFCLDSLGDSLVWGKAKLLPNG